MEMLNYAGISIAAGLVVAGASTQPAAAAPAETYTDLQHNLVLAAEFHEDDSCGARASTETFINRTQLTRLTELADGSFHFVDFETGVVATDFVDPAIPDTIRRRTETFEVNLTPGQTFVVNSTLRDSDGTMTVSAHYHLTEVDGVPRVEREVSYVVGCP
jgi:hypothetical protein